MATSRGALLVILLTSSAWSACAGDGPDDGATGDDPPQGWPGPENTGIRDGCPAGLRVADADDLRPESGMLVECVRFTDVQPYVAQDVDGATFRHCRFETTHTSPDDFVNVQGPNATFEDSEFVGGVETWIRTSYEGRGLVVRGSEFTGMANAVEWGTDGALIEDNYIHDFGSVLPAQHADGLQTDGAAHAVVRHNTVFLDDVTGATAAIGIWATGGDVTDVLVEDNLLAGGGYTVYPGVEQGGSVSSVRFVGNRFSTRFSTSCGQFGPRYPDHLAADLVWEDNVWLDGPLAGQPVE